MYIKKSISMKQLNSHKDGSGTLFLEINLRLRKWLIVGAHKPPDQSKSVFLESLSKSLSIYLDIYENVILLRDFTMTPEDKNLQLFANSFNLEHPIKKPTCFKGSPSCIELIITNRKAYLKKQQQQQKKTCVLEIGMLDFHKLTGGSSKSQILKARPERKLHRDYKVLHENSFSNDIRFNQEPS